MAYRFVLFCACALLQYTDTVACINAVRWLLRQLQCTSWCWSLTHLNSGSELSSMSSTRIHASYNDEPAGSSSSALWCSYAARKDSKPPICTGESIERRASHEAAFSRGPLVNRDRIQLILCSLCRASLCGLSCLGMQQVSCSRRPSQQGRELSPLGCGGEEPLCSAGVFQPPYCPHTYDGSIHLSAERR